LREAHALGQPGEHPGDAHLVDRLARLPGAGRADVDDARGVGLEHRLRRGHCLGGAAAHDRQLAILGPACPPETGASSARTPSRSAAPAIRRAIAGETVV
jgi:hypothetical protein